MRKTLLTILTALALTFTLHSQEFNYAEALQKSIFFYECQRSGDIENWSVENRVTWRANSAMEDGSDVGHDLTGGWYDAGDHVKFNFPMAYSATTLAWGALDFREGFVNSGQLDEIQNNLRWVAEYLIKCHTAPNELWGQVGNGSLDHSWWGSAEVYPLERPSYKIDAQNPGSDLAAETAAALASISIVFESIDPQFSQTCLEHAIQIYNFADTYRGVYHESITDATGYYRSHSGYQDELVWGALWLYKATDNPAYLTKAQQEYALLSNEQQTNYKSYKWGLAWDDKAYGCYVLMAGLTNEQQYIADIERHLDYWTDGFEGSRITYTPGGLAWLMQWGSNRHAANTALVAFCYTKYFPNSTKTQKYYDFAVSQMNYILGDNPQERSYVCGFGINPPVNPHHRTAHGTWADGATQVPEINRHILYGALCGGPGDNDEYEDDRNNYINNEVACDYNAGFTGALAKMVMDFGGEALSNFPIEEEPEGEYFIEAKVNAGSANFSEYAIWFHNRSAWPARLTDNASFRFYIDITEGLAAGYSANDYTVNVRGNATASNLQVCDEEENIYFVEVTYNVDIYPGGQTPTKEEAQLNIGLPSNAPAGAWDPTNDFSAQGITGSMDIAENIAMFNDGQYLAGNQPNSCAVGTSAVNARFTASTTIGTVPVEVDFDANKSSGPEGVVLSYSWDFGDGSSATGITTSHEYTDPGNYVVTLTVTGGEETDSRTMNINVIGQEPPVAKITATPLSGLLPLDVSFSAASSTDPNFDELTYTWNFGDGTPNATGETTSHIYSEKGEYTVTLTANDGNGGTHSTTTTIIVYDPADCNLLTIYGLPQDDAFGSLNTNFEHAYTIGEGGPDLSNVNNVSINWDLGNNGLYVFAFNTSNGVPDYYVSLLPAITSNNLNGADPSLTFASNGFANLEGRYYIGEGEGYVILIHESNGHAIYLTNDDTEPEGCSGSSECDSDTEEPVITSSHDDIDIEGNVEGEYELPDYTIGVTATDNCDNNLTITQSPIAGTIVSGDDNEITLTVTDNAGNSATESFNVNVTLPSAPEITSVHSDAELIANTNCEAVLPDYLTDITLAGSTAGVNLEQTPPAGSAVSGTTNVVTLRASLSATLYDEVTFNVSVVDETAPVITSAHNNITLTGNSEGDTTLADYTADVIATDNCDDNLTVTQSPVAGTTISGSGNIITLTVSDDAGNSTTETFTISVNIAGAPVITSTHNNQELDADPYCTATLPDYTGDVTVEGGNAGITITQTPVGGTTISGTVNEVTLSATSSGGVTSSVTFNVAVVDVTAPVITSSHSDIEIDGNANGQTQLGSYVAEVTATDNCDNNLTVVQTPVAGTTISGNSNTITLTVSDDSGNETSIAFNITVNASATAPVITSAHSDKEISSNQNCVATLPDYTESVTIQGGNAGIIITQLPAAGSVISGSLNTITLTATNAFDLSSSVNFNISVVDQVSPVIATTYSNMELDGNANGEAVLPNYINGIEVSDNCDNDLTISQTPNAGTTISGADNTVTITVIDDAGNSTTASFSVTVNTPKAPVITSVHTNKTLLSNANCVAILPDYTDDIVLENESSEVTISQDPVPGTVISGDTNLVILTVTNSYGLTSSASFNVAVKDETSPVITSKIVVEDLVGNSEGEAILPDFTEQVLATDNCDDDLKITQNPEAGSILSGNNNIVKLTAIDDAGNEASEIFTVSVTKSTTVSSNSSNNIAVYPNPSQGAINIICDVNSSIVVYDVAGNTIRNIVAENNLTTIDLSNESEGLYFVKIYSEDNISINRIVLE